MDRDGQLAREGTVVSELLTKLVALPHHHKAPPKSLGREWLETQVWPHVEGALVRHSLEDVMATAVEYVATTVVRDVPAGSTVLVTGGTWDTQSQSLHGTMAEKMVASYNFDYAFVGATGMDLERGTTTFNELTQLTRSMAEASQQVVLMAESEKFSRKMPNVELPWQGISTLITDTELASETKTMLMEQDIEVITTL